MLSLLEVLAGLAMVYLGLSGMRKHSLSGLVAGIVSIVGLLMAVHGTLIFNVPQFFK